MSTQNTTTAKFEAGKTYLGSYDEDYRPLRITIERRTNSSVWVDGKRKKIKIDDYNGEEYITFGIGRKQRFALASDEEDKPVKTEVETTEPTPTETTEVAEPVEEPTEVEETATKFEVGQVYSGILMGASVSTYECVDITKSHKSAWFVETSYNPISEIFQTTGKKFRKVIKTDTKGNQFVLDNHTTISSLNTETKEVEEPTTQFETGQIYDGIRVERVSKTRKTIWLKDVNSGDILRFYVSITENGSEYVKQLGLYSNSYDNALITDDKIEVAKPMIT